MSEIKIPLGPHIKPLVISASELTRPLRFANVYFPATLLVTQATSVQLMVHVAQRHAAASMFTPSAAEMTLEEGDLTIVIQAESFDVTETGGGLPALSDPPKRVVQVEADRDCEPAVFMLTPQGVGDRRIKVCIDQFGRNILTQAFQVGVVATMDATASGSAAVASPNRGTSAQSPDLELRVTLSDDQRRLSFMLHGGATYNFRPAGEVVLPRDLRVWLQPFLDRLNILTRRSTEAHTPAETEAVKTDLANHGASLFVDLFPEQLKAEYGKTIRTKFTGKRLAITSDEQWIPWEIIQPFAVGDEGQTLYNDPPLGEMFRLSVWDPDPIESSIHSASGRPDLELRVMLSGDQRKLSFMLHGGATYNYKPVGEIEMFAESPRAYLQPMFKRLSALAGRSASMRTAAETEVVKQELATLGNDLFDKLFSKELKEEYGTTIREQFKEKSLMITSDEPWIPWEILRPFAVDKDGNVLYDDEPLCERFCLSRWLVGRFAPDQLLMKEGAWVVPPGSAPEAEAENRYFQELHRRQWQVRLSGPLTRTAEVRARIVTRGTQLLHFACHGNFEAINPENSMIKLADGYFSPGQIDARMGASLTAAKPVVFLNAGHSGETGFDLTGMGGWAEKLLGWGASAFIGSLWEINGKLAAQFAQEFYNRLWGINGFEGQAQPLGQAFHDARQVIKAVDEANPTWLSYVLYGDPQARIVLGSPETQTLSLGETQVESASKEAHTLLKQLIPDHLERGQEQEVKFRDGLSTQTLSNVLDEVAEAWSELSPDVRQYIRAVMRSRGAQIADSEIDQFGVVEQINDLLKALWLARAKLPAAAVQALHTGQSTGESADRITSVPDDVRATLVKKMLVRAYKDPELLAAELDELIAAHDDRLVVAELITWRALREAFRQNGQTTPYLHATESLLGDYPAVKRTLRANQIWELAPAFREEPSKPSVAPVAQLPESLVIELRVVLSIDRSTLAYTLHLPGLGYDHQPCGQVVLGAAPMAALQHTIDRLDSLVRESAEIRTAFETANAERELALLGANLYRDFFSPELKQAYRELRETCAGCSLLIISDEPYIAWELIRPVEVAVDGTLIYDDPPLCETFQVMRWLSRPPAADALVLKKGIWTVLPANMREAQFEKAYFGQLSQHLPQVELIGPVAKQGELEEYLLNGESQLFHLATFSSFESDRPDDSKLRLEDGFLQPGQLSGAIQAGLQRAKPLVFMNTDNAARLGFAANGQLDGWAARFIAAGATAFAGLMTMGSVPLTGRFAQEFYDRLFGLHGHEPRSLGQAFHEARQVIKEADPANPTWLAYTLYGNPNMRVTLSRRHKEPLAWTVLWYITGGVPGADDVSKMLQALLDIGDHDRIAILAQVNAPDPLTGARRFDIQPGRSLQECAIKDAGEIQGGAGDPQTLRDFIIWGCQRNPAKQQLLVISNLGSGWREEDVHADRLR